MGSHPQQKSIQIWREKNEEAEVVREVLLFFIFFTNFKQIADAGKGENSEAKEDASVLKRNVCSTYFTKEKKRIPLSLYFRHFFIAIFTSWYFPTFW